MHYRGVAGIENDGKTRRTAINFTLIHYAELRKEKDNALHFQREREAASKSVRRYRQCERWAGQVHRNVLLYLPKGETWDLSFPSMATFSRTDLYLILFLKSDNKGDSAAEFRFKFPPLK